MMREKLKDLVFAKHTNNNMFCHSFYRRARSSETTIFSIPIRKIKEEIPKLLRQLEKGNKLNPFSQQIPDEE